jgi:hypothetical protein
VAKGPTAYRPPLIVISWLCGNRLLIRTATSMLNQLLQPVLDAIATIDKICLRRMNCLLSALEP